MDLADKYRVIAELGHGGMATVHLAVTLGSSGFRKLAVLKRVRPEYAQDRNVLAMFRDEARLCARLTHRNIVQTYDVGVDGSDHVIAMEYLDGVSLHAARARLASRAQNRGEDFAPLAVEGIILLEVLEALRYAHELRDYDRRPLGIVHRDVSPHNVFITYDGQVKLLDFGIAKAATSSVRTETGTIKGKLTYMAPEQAMGGSVDPRTDVYALGVLLWEAIAGRRRFAPGASEVEVLTRVLSGELPEPPGAAGRGYPAELDAVVLRALAPDPRDRTRSAAELHAALERALRRVDALSARAVGAILSRAFASERDERRRLIEEQIRRVDVRRSGSGRAPIPLSLPGSHSPIDDPIFDLRGRIETVAPSVLSRVTDSTAPAKVNRTPGRLRAAGVTLTAVCLIAGVAWRAREGLARPVYRAAVTQPDVAQQAIPSPALGVERRLSSPVSASRSSGERAEPPLHPSAAIQHEARQKAARAVAAAHPHTTPPLPQKSTRSELGQANATTSRAAVAPGDAVASPSNPLHLAIEREDPWDTSQ